MSNHKTPGVYIEEIQDPLPSISSVETAIPAFIGYTEKAQFKEPNDLLNMPKRIESIPDYEAYFGFSEPEKSIEIIFDNTGNNPEVKGMIDPDLRSNYLMYYSLQMYFANGGGPCWIVSVGDYTTTAGVILYDDLKRGLDEIEKVDEVTLILFPDSLNLQAGLNYYELHEQAMSRCFRSKDRFVIMDVHHVPGNSWNDDVEFLRSALPNETDHLKFGAAYFPKIYTHVKCFTKDEFVKITGNNIGNLPLTLDELKDNNNTYYNLARSAINDIEMLLPASPAVAGVYAQVDSSRGVWKSPANINIDQARPEYLITNQEQENLNVDPQTGKSINVIRTFPGRGSAMIWGARTLAGNDNEWRYISVRRFFIMVEESVKTATRQFVFEPNDANTWVKIKAMISNYLTRLWKAGALMGTTTKDAFYVHTGLGETMTNQDISEGRLIIEIGLAVVRPAEFIILRFMHKMEGS